MRLHEIAQPETPAKQFMTAFNAATKENGFNHRQRVFDNSVIIELAPDIGNRKTGIHIVDIKSIDPKKGMGTKAMQFIVNLADKYGVDLDLAAVDYSEQWTSKKLASWYKRFGFAVEKGDAKYGYVMRRRQKGTTASPERTREAIPSTTETSPSDGPLRIKLRGFNREH